MSAEDPRTPLHPSLALAAYAGGLLRGRRAAVLGDSASGLAECIAGLTGRRVHAYDAVRDRVAASIARSRGPQSQVSFAPLEEARDAHGAAFDAVIVSELWRREAKATIDLARELLSPRGVVIVASANPDDLDNEPQDVLGYYELYDALADRFENVRMLGQAPFVGYTVAEFALEGEPAVTIDTSLVTRTEDPRFFVAVASDHDDQPLDPYTLVQMPLDGIGPTLLGSGAPAPEATAELAEARVQISVLEAELDKTQDQVREARERSKERQAAATVMSARLAELQAASEEQRAKLARELDALRRDNDKLRKAADEDRGQSGRFREELDRATERAERAERRLGDVRNNQDVAERKARELEQRLSALHREQKRLERERDEARDASEPLEGRVAELESALRDAEQGLAAAKPLEKRIGELEATLRDAEKAARRELRDKLEQAAEAHQSDLDTMLERIADLEAELEARPEPVEEAPSAEPTLDARGLQFQVDELRTSLQNVRAENDALKKRAHAAETTRDELRVELRRAATSTGDDEAESGKALDAAEARLRTQAQHIRRLEAELREGQRIGAELLRRFERQGGKKGSGSAGGEGGAHRGRNGVSGSVDATEFDALRQRAARSEADLQAAQWTIDSLRAKVSEPTDTPPPERMLEEALRAAQAEVAQLRRALDKGGA